MSTLVIAAGINDLRQTVHKCAVDHGWWEEERSLPELIALMHSELSEALEEWRDGDDITKIRYTDSDGAYIDPRHDVTEYAKPVGVASEFADVIIRILDTCEQLDIPITKALLDKHAYNLTRPYRHGGKRA